MRSAGSLSANVQTAVGITSPCGWYTVDHCVVYISTLCCSCELSYLHLGSYPAFVCLSVCLQSSVSNFTQKPLVRLSRKLYILPLGSLNLVVIRIYSVSQKK